ncbi:leucyl aminopeptidase family protein [Shimia abyssi]|uniref:Leucyl aminopeptidase n=1 Tax=Shimia abyssi TaxID=1662395 RepID=A0A2P8FKT9_9RHOB|nr:leucyl aminopeptidase family protein [Shimia abyssi]PSL22326.1 leucyl aminopeptidase [Shimia abyssi]
MSLTFASAAANALPLHVLDMEGFDEWLRAQPPTARTWITASGFQPTTGKSLLVPDSTGAPIMALGGYGSAASRARARFPLAAIAANLPKGTYTLANELPDGDLDTELLGWLLSAYTFDRYTKRTVGSARLICPKGVDAIRIESLAAGEALTRDLINTPASDMGPAALEESARLLAQTFDAAIKVATGEDLLAQNFPMIHAVGRAAAQHRAPRLIDIRWGNTGPALTLVGKGVCFDTGGLNLKPGNSMALMKKDMGGAATVLGLAHMIMSLNLPLRLRVLIPAVENAVSADSFRPGDILTSRKGLTVEINNTDAEGRLVLADALALASEDTPDLLISMATLTGAARVAVGPDLAPYFTDDAAFAAALESSATETSDPVWRLPFWEPYEKMIEPGIADLDNAPSGGMAGSITAALFLRRFASDQRYAHFDIYGWNPSPAPARPKGGVAMGARAILNALPKLLDL